MSYSVKTDFDSSNAENKLHTVVTPNGLVEASVSNYGLALVYFGLKHESTDSNYHNITCKFDDGADYKRSDNPFFGAFVGRVANRLRAGKFTLDGVDYQLVQNNFGHCLHGGDHGYDKVLYADPEVVPAIDTASPKLKFSYVSKHLEEGFPGELLVSITYWVEDAPTGGALFLEYEAKLVGPETVDHAILNLTNHSYFNIGPEPTIAGTEVTMITNDSLEVDDTFVPTGKIVKFPLVPADLSTFTLGAVDPDIDNCFVFPSVPDLDASDTRSFPMQIMASTYHPVTKIHFVGETTEPAFQLYTGKYVDVDGLYGVRAGFCLESSRYIDGINNPVWSRMFSIGKNDTYGSRTKFSLYY
ncbi:galactose mutarotase-like domain-containing protein [Lipomyces arxii]|uniref:galactose mutarotase-like domain-containing protein n=1 Tax=Lipomyces arxii TaxID=56418 RepID=UPI0034CF1D4E